MLRCWREHRYPIVMRFLLRAAADGLVTLHQRFAPCFRYQQAQGHAQVYLKGLLLAEVSMGASKPATSGRFKTSQVTEVYSFRASSVSDRHSRYRRHRQNAPSREQR